MPPSDIIKFCWDVFGKIQLRERCRYKNLAGHVNAAREQMFRVGLRQPSFALSNGNLKLNDFALRRF